MKFKKRSQKRKGKTIENRNENYQQNRITIFNSHFNRKSFTRMTIINRSLKQKFKAKENRYVNYVH